MLIHRLKTDHYSTIGQRRASSTFTGQFFVHTFMEIGKFSDNKQHVSHFVLSACVLLRHRIKTACRFLHVKDIKI